MNILRVVAVDDETLALRRLKLLLQAIPNVEPIGEASSCAEALAKIASLKPDVVLLDIRMRDGSGFDVLEELARQANPPVVVFVTAFENFAVRAFETAVADYLLKPVERDRLSSALTRAREQLRAIDAEQQIRELQAVIRNLRSSMDGAESPFETEFWMRSASGLVRVPVDAIDCVSSEDEYVAIHTLSGSHLMRSSIRRFEERVEPDLFVRVHRRWLVRKTAIAELRTRRIGGAEVVLLGGKRVPAGRVYLKQLRRIIQGGGAARVADGGGLPERRQRA